MKQLGLKMAWPYAKYSVIYGNYIENDCNQILLNKFYLKYDVLAINSFVKEWNQPGIYTLGIRYEDSWSLLFYVIIMIYSYTLWPITRKERPKYHHWRNSEQLK